MDVRLKEMLARVDWKNANSVDDLVRVQTLAFESALAQIQSLDPAVAGAYAATLTAGLPDYVRNTLFVAAQERQQEQWKAEAKAAARQDWREDADNIRRNMVQILWAEWQQEVRREQIERGRQLEQLAARWNRMTQQQLLVFALSVIENERVPVERKRSWEKAAIFDQITDTLLADARKKARDPNSLRIIDGIDKALSSDKLREAIQADVQRTPEGNQTVAVADVQRRLTEAVQGMEGLTPEQRARVGDLMAKTVHDYAAKRGLENGIPADAASLTQHVAGLRGVAVNSLMEALLDEDLALDPEVYERLVEHVESRIDGIKTNGPGRAAAFADVHDAVRDTLRQQGVDVSAMHVEVAAADIGRAALKDAERLIKEPQKATREDLDMVVGLSHAAEASISQIASLEPRPQPQRPDLSRWQALQPLQQQGRGPQAPEAEPDGYDPKPH
jgi:hypothetical protein